MKEFFLALLLIIFFALLEVTVLSASLVLLLVLSLGALRRIRSGLFWAFFGGIIVDLTAGKFLGNSSLVFLLIVFLLNLYKVKFKATNLFYLLPFTFLSSLFYSFWESGPTWPFLNLAITSLLFLLVWPLANLFLAQKNSETLQLPLKL